MHGQQNVKKCYYIRSSVDRQGQYLKLRSEMCTGISEEGQPC